MTSEEQEVSCFTEPVKKQHPLRSFLWPRLTCERVRNVVLHFNVDEEGGQGQRLVLLIPQADVMIPCRVSHIFKLFQVTNIWTVEICNKLCHVLNDVFSDLTSTGC